MQRLFTILGFTWAVICLLIILIMFPGLDNFSRQVAKLSFMKVNPTLSGGDIVRSIEYKDYTLHIYEPVFEALIGESSNGFIQMGWTWKDSIPVPVTDSIDLNMDDLVDFIISIDPSEEEVRIIPLESGVGDIIAESRIPDGWIVRVGLINEKKLNSSRR